LLANLAAIYLFHDVCVDVHMQPLLNANHFILLSRLLGHHVRTLSFDLSALWEDFEQPQVVHCITQTLPNLPNIRYLTIGCDTWKTVTNSAITNAIAKLQQLEWVAFSGLAYGSIDYIYSPLSPTFFDTTFNQILLSRAEQLTSLSLDRCPFHCAPGTFQLLRKTAKNLQSLTLNASLPASLWQVFSEPVTWACADRLITLDITDIHGVYVPILVEHIASGRFGNLKRLLIDMHWADRDRQIATPAIEWSIRPLDVLTLSQVPKLELEIFGCLHAKEVHVEGVSEQAMIELVQGGSFKEMKVLRIWQPDWKYMRLEELTTACANRKAELLFK
jgi:hypothetical protein